MRGWKYEWIEIKKNEWLVYTRFLSQVKEKRIFLLILLLLLVLLWVMVVFFFWRVFFFLGFPYFIMFFCQWMELEGKIICIQIKYSRYRAAATEWIMTVSIYMYVFIFSNYFRLVINVCSKIKIFLLKDWKDWSFFIFA